MAASISSNQEVVDNGGLVKKIDAAGWGLFFVWVGTAFITNIVWGTGLVGVGIIILLGQAARKYFGVKTDIFGILLGSFFVLGGLWELYAIQFSLVPIICAVGGLTLLVSAVVRKTQR
jgi:hypothetical protein